MPYGSNTRALELTPLRGVQKVCATRFKGDHKLRKRSGLVMTDLPGLQAIALNPASNLDFHINPRCLFKSERLEAKP